MVNFDVFVQVWTNTSNTSVNFWHEPTKTQQTKQYFMTSLSWTIGYHKTWKNFCFTKNLKLESNVRDFSDKMHFLFLMKSWFAVILLPPQVQTPDHPLAFKRKGVFSFSPKKKLEAILFYCPCHTFQIKVVCKADQKRGTFHNFL